MGVMWRFAGVVLRASAVVGIWWAWEVAHEGGPPTDDMSGVAVLFVLTAVVIFVWGVIDGTRGPAARAAVTWMSALLCLAVPVVVLLLTGGQALGGPGLFAVVLVGGVLLLMVLVPALLGAVLGAALRVLMQKVA